MSSKNLPIFIFAFTSLFYLATGFSMESSSDPSRLFFEKLRNLQVSLTYASGLQEDNNFSLAEVIILRIEKERPIYHVVHVNYAFEYYVQKTIPITPDMPEISVMQIKNIKAEKAYYEYLRKKIYQKCPQGQFQDFKPTTKQLDQQIPNFDQLSQLFQKFLDYNGSISKGELLSLKKWLVFDCCDQVFSSLGTRAGFNIGVDRQNLESISHTALKEKPLGTWLCRPSVSFPDDDDTQKFCRTIIFNPCTASLDFNALRIIHVFGLGFFEAGDLNKPESWHHHSSLVQILRYWSKKAFLLNKYFRVEKSVYMPRSEIDEILDSNY